MFPFTPLSAWSRSRKAWLALFLSAFVLELTALYFQYGMDLRPCIMCIYQRTAMFGIMFSALIPALGTNTITRLIGTVGWAVSSVWGLLIAWEHVDIQTAANPFFASCEIVPNFPSWLQLHEWLPAIFEASGDCGDIDWQFLSLSMPQWMIVIFAVYAGICALVLISQFSKTQHR